jgi:hypothetical protein
MIKASLHVPSYAKWERAHSLGEILVVVLGADVLGVFGVERLFAHSQIESSVTSLFYWTSRACL